MECTVYEASTTELVSELVLISLYSVLKETVGIGTVTQREIALVLDDLILTNHERARGLTTFYFGNGIPGNAENRACIGMSRILNFSNMQKVAKRPIMN